VTAGSLPLQVLIVDDEPAILRFLRTSLRAQGYQTIEAETGAQALSTFARNRVDVVVLDLGLPDLDGLEVLKRLRARRW
jgi:two-component system KDP operon response regulator KdpE